jgi:hypothetical protein
MATAHILVKIDGRHGRPLAGLFSALLRYELIIMSQFPEIQ